MITMCILASNRSRTVPNMAKFGVYISVRGENLEELWKDDSPASRIVVDY